MAAESAAFFGADPDVFFFAAAVDVFAAVAEAFFAAVAGAFFAAVPDAFFGAAPDAFFGAAPDAFAAEGAAGVVPDDRAEAEDFVPVVPGFFAAEVVFVFSTAGPASSWPPAPLASSAVSRTEASSAVGVSSEEEEVAEVTNEIYQLDLTIADGRRNCEKPE